MLLDDASGAALADSMKSFVFDCDGVLWRGDQLVPGVLDALRQLRDKQGKALLFVTNNSSKSRSQYASKFKALGLDVSPEEILPVA